MTRPLSLTPYRKNFFSPARVPSALPPFPFFLSAPFFIGKVSPFRFSPPSREESMASAAFELKPSLNEDLKPGPEEKEGDIPSLR